MSNQYGPLSEIEGDEPIPAELARALDESAEDLRHGRLEDVEDFLSRMEARLQSHLASKGRVARPAE